MSSEAAAKSDVMWSAPGGRLFGRLETTARGRGVQLVFDVDVCACVASEELDAEVTGGAVSDVWSSCRTRVDTGLEWDWLVFCHFVPFSRLLDDKSPPFASL